jgi:N-acetylglucosaminyldiphosphoundecaprenol N-acetyl-beta-D-mannosaminyltransferase
MQTIGRDKSPFELIMKATDTNGRQDDQQQYQNILGVRFFTGSAESAVRIGMQGGLVVVPAAPALVDLRTNKHYREALYNADLAITDSGLMVLLWQMLTFKVVARVSGLKYLKLLFEWKALQPRESVLWIMPGEAARDENLAWLHSQGYDFTKDDCYVAPHYKGGEIQDDVLVKLVRERKPRHIVVCLGGGTQERLGLMLKRACDFKPSIHCIGAAIGFLTGNQVHIPTWADKFFLGWFFRCLSEPKKFGPRYLKAFKLVPLMIRYRDRAPDLVSTT